MTAWSVNTCHAERASGVEASNTYFAKQHEEEYMLSALLAERERQGKPIRVGIIGA